MLCGRSTFVCLLMLASLCIATVLKLIYSSEIILLIAITVLDGVVFLERSD